ncbi:hypothetical protein [Sulfitobacter sp. 1A15106]|uniref:hypothetical protein n=1 Tax=Sulfitobacter sp. 1A15106 TaxID=3368590 RepID=UPI003746F736
MSVLGFLYFLCTGMFYVMGGLAIAAGCGIFIAMCLPEKYLGNSLGRMWASMEMCFWQGYHDQRQEQLEEALLKGSKK